MNRIAAGLRELSEGLRARHAEQGWAPLWSLLYLGFLFINYNGRPASVWLPPTVLSVCVFLPLYYRALQVCGRRRLYYGAAIALIGYALIAINTGANTYLIYAGACAGAGLAAGCRSRTEGC